MDMRVQKINATLRSLPLALECSEFDGSEKSPSRGFIIKRNGKTLGSFSEVSAALEVLQSINWQVLQIVPLLTLVLQFSAFADLSVARG